MPVSDRFKTHKQYGCAQNGAFSDELRLVRWYRIVDVEHPWRDDGPPSDDQARATDVHEETALGMDVPTGPPSLIPPWPNLLMGGLSAPSAFAVGVFAAIGRHKRH